jgi:hypothetical protein
VPRRFLGFGCPPSFSLEHLQRLVLAGMAMLANPSSPYFEQEKMDVMASARALGRKLHIFTASNAMEIETAVSSLREGIGGLREGIGGLLVGGDPYFDGGRDRLVSLAARYSVPTVYQWRNHSSSTCDDRCHRSASPGLLQFVRRSEGCGDEVSDLRL